MHTLDRSVITPRKIVIFGAGKIGRAFIGQLFGCAGYLVVFVDVNQAIVDGLNRKGNYRVIIKGDAEEEIIVPNVQAISSLDRDKVIKAVSTAEILAVSVGKNALEIIIPFIAAGLAERNQNNLRVPLDIILAENMRSAADFVREQLLKYLPSDFPLECMVGLVETSIGKMVPIIPQVELEKDSLVVFAEPYNTLIVDRKGFKSSIPDIKGLSPKNNIKAWVDRKAFIHNLGHATAAYYGYKLNPEATYIFEVLDDREVLGFTRAVMLQSAKILKAAYPDEFTIADLENHIDDLIIRFRNEALRDTIFRVGQDLPRKLGFDDRFMGSVHLARQYQMPYNLIIKAMSYGLNFKAKDECGNNSSADIKFQESLAKNFELTFFEMDGYDRRLDLTTIMELKQFYHESNP